jgi:ribonuclease D
LTAIFENKDILKIFFAGEHDVLIIKNNLFCNVYPFYDLQTAYKYIFNKRQTIGLARLIEEFFNTLISKENQRSKWDKRPLSEELLTYAAQDVSYLPLLWDILNPMLFEQGMNKIALMNFYGMKFIKAVHPIVRQKSRFMTIVNYKQFSDYEKLVAKRILEKLNVIKIKNREQKVNQIIKARPKTIGEIRKIIKSGKLKESVINDILHILETSVYDATKNTIMEDEIRIIERFKDHLELLKTDMTPEIDMDLKEYIINVEKLKSWVEKKRNLLHVPKEYIIPISLIKELSKYDSETVKSTEVFKVVKENIREDLLVEFLTLFGSKI